MTPPIYPPIVSIVGKSGSGKTTLLENLIPRLKARGLRVGTVKHDVHGFVMDKPGKDSWRHKRAGADTTVISSPRQIGMVRDVDHDFDLDELASFFPDVHIVLTEGYKRGGRPKLEIFRPEVHREPLCRGDENLLALVSDTPLDLGVPRFALDDVEGLCRFLVDRFGLSQVATAGAGSLEHDS